MKLLLASDLHRDTIAAARLVRNSHDVDVVVLAGDLATARRGLTEMIAVLKAIERPTILVPGNSETDVELAEACEVWPAAVPLHGASAALDGVTFFGLGAATPRTPFGDWSFDLSEDEAEALLAKCRQADVLVTHSPPAGWLDLSSSGRGLGSRAVRAAVERLKPQLVVCGHIHASGGRSLRVGGCTIVNAGPRGMTIDLPDPGSAGV